jgi:hypothetical protein
MTATSMSLAEQTAVLFVSIHAQCAWIQKVCLSSVEDDPSGSGHSDLKKRTQDATNQPARRDLGKRKSWPSRVKTEATTSHLPCRNSLHYVSLNELHKVSDVSEYHLFIPPLDLSYCRRIETREAALQNTSLWKKKHRVANSSNGALRQHKTFRYFICCMICTKLLCRILMARTKNLIFIQ